MFTTSKVDTLRKAHYALKHLPSMIFVTAADRLASQSRAIEHATIDEVAFAIVRSEQTFSEAGDRLAALRKLYDLARKGGGIGADRAVEAAANAGTER